MRPQRPIRGDRGNRDGCSRTRALAVLAGSPVADSGPEMGARRHPDRTNGGRHAWALSLDGPDMSGAGYRSLNEFRSLLKESIRNDDQLHDRCNPDRDGGPMRSDISQRRHTTMQSVPASLPRISGGDAVASNGLIPAPLVRSQFLALGAGSGYARSSVQAFPESTICATFSNSTYIDMAQPGPAAKRVICAVCRKPIQPGEGRMRRGLVSLHVECAKREKDRKKYE
jgi:hypothetical protein